MKAEKLLICFLVGLCFISCSLWPKGGPKKDRQTRGESQFDPLGFPQDRVIVTEEKPGKKIPPTSRTKENSIIGSEDLDEEGIQKVYRVQFFATKYPDEASQVAKLVSDQLSEKAYIHYKTPYYWVRLGDCQTKEEAEILLNRIKKLGYGESWVVEVELKLKP